jgi:hypothetical protein
VQIKLKNISLPKTPNMKPKIKLKKEKTETARVSAFTSVGSHHGGSIRHLPICGERDADKAGYSTFEWHSKMCDDGGVIPKLSKI